MTRVDAARGLPGRTDALEGTGRVWLNTGNVTPSRAGGCREKATKTWGLLAVPWTKTMSGSKRWNFLENVLPRRPALGGAEWPSQSGAFPGPGRQPSPIHHPRAGRWGGSGRRLLEKRQSHWRGPFCVAASLGAEVPSRELSGPWRPGLLARSWALDSSLGPREGPRHVGMVQEGAWLSPGCRFRQSGT